jgi:hypothetical protein
MFIRSKPCLKCCRYGDIQINVVPAHQNFGFGSMGSKASDLWTIPLCTDCHLQEHNQGHETFWEGYDLKLECLKLINEYFTQP